MATGEENVSEDLKKLTLDLKKAAAKLHTLFDCYDSKNYPVNILRTNKIIITFNKNVKTVVQKCI